MSIAVSWTELVQLKKAAKAAKDSLPQLSHMQRLDALAREKFGVRHFHELQKLYDASVAQHVDQEGRTHRCRYCHFQFVGELAGDVQAHMEHHHLYEEAEAALGFLPLPYSARERLKKPGYVQLHATDEAQARLGGLLVMLGHFERSLETAISGGFWHRHPCFKRYIAYVLPTAGYMPEPLRQRLIREFGSRPGVIETGTSWPSRAQPDRPDAVAVVKESMELRAAVLKAAETLLEAA